MGRRCEISTAYLAGRRMRLRGAAADRRDGRPAGAGAPAASIDPAPPAAWDGPFLDAAPPTV